MFFRIDFLIGAVGEKKNPDSLYILADNQEDAISRAQSFAEKIFPNMDIVMESLLRLPAGTIVTCLQSMEFVPKDTPTYAPVLFSTPSVLVS